MNCKRKTTYKQTAPLKSALWYCTGALLLFLLSVHTANAQMSFTALDTKMAKEKKLIVIYISSKYCTYCLMQEAQIKKNSQLKNRLDSDFYFVKGQAEDGAEIVFNHKKYTNPNPENPYGVNDFVTLYGRDEKGFLGYPLWLYFDREYRLLLRFHGLMPPKNILKVLDEIEKSDILNNKQYRE